MDKIKEWQELSRETVFKKYGRGIEKVVFKMPDGRESDFYIKEEGMAVVIFPITADNKIVMVRQYRPGPKKILLELPGGFLGENDDPTEMARRELLEETGYEGDFKLITTCLDDGYSTRKRYCFVATNCKKVAEIKNEIDEFTEDVLVTVDELKKILRGGQLTDLEAGFLGLNYLGLL